MSPELLGFINKFMYLDEIDSTSLEAKRLVRKGHIGNFVVISDHQTSGRGRASNVWWSGKDSLTFTLVLTEINNLIELPLIIGLSVREVLQPLITENIVTVKWPNDIMVDSKKICGILCETEQGTESKTRVLIGVGINVNDTAANAPEEIRDTFVSIYDIMDKKLDKTWLLSSLLISFKKNLAHLSQSGFVYFMESWKTHDYLKNRFVEVGYPGDMIKGKVLGVSKDGRLRILAKNKVKEILSGTVNVV